MSKWMLVGEAGVKLVVCVGAAKTLLEPISVAVPVLALAVGALLATVWTAAGVASKRVSVL